MPAHCRRAYVGLPGPAKTQPAWSSSARARSRPAGSPVRQRAPRPGGPTLARSTAPPSPRCRRGSSGTRTGCRAAPPAGHHREDLAVDADHGRRGLARAHDDDAASAVQAPRRAQQVVGEPPGCCACRSWSAPTYQETTASGSSDIARSGPLRRGRVAPVRWATAASSPTAGATRVGTVTSAAAGSRRRPTASAGSSRWWSRLEAPAGPSRPARPEVAQGPVDALLRPVGVPGRNAAPARATACGRRPAVPQLTPALAESGSAADSDPATVNEGRRTPCRAGPPGGPPRCRPTTGRPPPGAVPTGPAAR